MKFKTALKSVPLLAILTLAATIASAQDFEILNARYGSARRSIDVTRQLRQLARSNATFRLSWRTFGDPAEGQAKTLRIFARGPRGGNRFFEYHDNEVVDGSVFSGWGNGNWGNRPWQGGWNPGPAGRMAIPAFAHLQQADPQACAAFRFSAPDTVPADPRSMSPSVCKA